MACVLVLFPEISNSGGLGSDASVLFCFRPCQQCVGLNTDSMPGAPSLRA